ncbi:MAG: hypothetical protein IJ341_10460 [Bacteroidales bacterium]|nr:hypothetical protein [Bacteroidales bacterium]
MANVAFKRGLSAGLPSAGKALDGVFYLTTDTNRLYVGNADNNLVDLNRYISVVADTTSLPAHPAAGDFVWVSNGNMLLVCVNPSGTTIANTWTQINPPDTDSDTKVTKFTATDAVDATNNKITITLALDQTTTSVEGGKTYTSPAQLTTSFELTKDELNSVLDHNVGIAPSAITGNAGAKIALNGEGSNSAEFVNLKPGNNITITVSGDDVTITATDTKYDLKTEASTSSGIVVLHPLSDTGDDKVTFKSGNDAIAVASDAAGNVTYTHKAYSTTGTTSTATDKTPGHGGKFTVIDGITADKGHVTGYTTKEITLPTDNNTTYSISAANVTTNQKSKVTLTAGGTGSGTDNIYLAAGEDLVVNTSGSAGSETITYTHKDYGDLSASDSSASGTEIAPAHGGKFTVVDAITASNGHITGYTTKEVTLPADNNTKNTSADVTVTGGSVSISVTDSDSNSVEDTASNVLYHKITVDGTEKTVYNQSGLGAFYSASKVDEKLNAVNAMTYKGTLGTGGTVTALPTTNVKIGDTYKVVTAGTWGTHACDIGDLLIATGTESGGVITSTTLTWTYVPSGDDTDTHYDISIGGAADAATLILGNSVTDDTDTVTFAGGTAIDVTPDSTNSKITIKHENVSRATTGITTTDAPTHGGTFTAVKSVESNAQGHVTKVVTTTVTLPSDNNTTYTHGFNANKQLVLTGANPGSTDPVNFVAGNDIVLTADTTGDTGLTIAHEDFTTAAAETANGGTLSHGDKFTAITAITADNGHVTGYQPTEWTLPSDNNTTYSISAVDVSGTASAKLRLTAGGTGSGTDDVTFTAGTDLTAEAASDVITFAHKTYNAPTASASSATDKTPAHGGKFTVIDGITASNGHVTGYTTKEITLPSDNNTTYTLSGHTVASKTVTNGSGATLTTTLTSSNPSGTTTATMDLTSTSLNVVAGTKAVTIDLVWGTF